MKRRDSEPRSPAWLVRVFLGLVIVGSIVPVSRGFAAGSRASNLTGHWHWAIQGKCVDEPSNPHACDQMLTMGLHVYDIRVTSLIYRGVDHISVGAGNRFTEHGSATFSAQSPGGVALSACDPNLMQRELFRRTCHVTWRGVGHIARGGTFLLDFFSDSGKLTYKNRAITYYVSYTAAGDSLIPAVARTYSSRQYLDLVGQAQFMPGITISLKVKHISG
jgi:hypothetical protein